MSLVTGRRLRRNKFTELPLPEWVVDRAHHMAQRQDQAWMPGGTPTVSTNKISDEVPALEESHIVPEEDSLNEEEEDEFSPHSSDDEHESVANEEDLGMIENNALPVDELGINDGRSE